MTESTETLSYSGVEAEARKRVSTTRVANEHTWDFSLNYLEQSRGRNALRC
jgi:hypothetical protein